ncbi:MAG TPA: hypothetical protein VJ183_05340 [Chloroflexia bacterium]|nr:hypothetical protein [Chloroflexia bacterium]
MTRSTTTPSIGEFALRSKPPGHEGDYHITRMGQRSWGERNFEEVFGHLRTGTVQSRARTIGVGSPRASFGTYFLGGELYVAVVRQEMTSTRDRDSRDVVAMTCMVVPYDEWSVALGDYSSLYRALLPYGELIKQAGPVPVDLGVDEGTRVAESAAGLPSNGQRRDAELAAARGTPQGQAPFPANTTSTVWLPVQSGAHPNARVVQISTEASPPAPAGRNGRTRSTARSTAASHTDPVHLARIREWARKVDAVGFEIVASVASKLLDGPVAILEGENMEFDARLDFLDAVTALLPYGVRVDLTSATWLDTALVKHNIRLAFCKARGDGQAGLEMSQLTRRGGHSIMTKANSPAQQYFGALGELRKKRSTYFLVEYLATCRAQLSFEEPDRIVDVLVASDAAVIGWSMWESGGRDPDRARELLWSSMPRQLPVDQEADLLQVVVENFDPGKKDAELLEMYFEDVASMYASGEARNGSVPAPHGQHSDGIARLEELWSVLWAGVRHHLRRADREEGLAALDFLSTFCSERGACGALMTNLVCSAAALQNERADTAQGGEAEDAVTDGVKLCASRAAVRLLLRRLWQIGHEAGPTGSAKAYTTIRQALVGNDALLFEFIAQIFRRTYLHPLRPQPPAIAGYVRDDLRHIEGDSSKPMGTSPSPAQGTLIKRLPGFTSPPSEGTTTKTTRLQESWTETLRQFSGGAGAPGYAVEDLNIVLQWLEDLAGSADEEIRRKIGPFRRACGLEAGTVRVETMEMLAVHDPQHVLTLAQLSFMAAGSPDAGYGSVKGVGAADLLPPLAEWLERRAVTLPPEVAAEWLDLFRVMLERILGSGLSVDQAATCGATMVRSRLEGIEREVVVVLDNHGYFNTVDNIMRLHRVVNLSIASPWNASEALRANFALREAILGLDLTPGVLRSYDRAMSSLLRVFLSTVADTLMDIRTLVPEADRKHMRALATGIRLMLRPRNPVGAFWEWLLSLKRLRKPSRVGSFVEDAPSDEGLPPPGEK